MEQFETMYKDVCVKFNATASETEHLRDSVSVYKTSGKPLIRSIFPSEHTFLAALDHSDQVFGG